MQAPYSSTNNAAGAIASPLKLPMAGFRIGGTGFVSLDGVYGFYRSSTGSNTDPRHIEFDSSYAAVTAAGRAFGMSVRCLRD